jgi:hypothetical protein
MFKSRWLVAVAFGLTLVTSGQAQEQAESSGRLAGQEQSQITPYIPKPFQVEIVEDDTQAEVRQHSEDESRKREIADLAAQEGMNAATQAMNRATQRMADYAFWSTVFVAIGTVLLVGTLILTWMANRSAQAAVAVTREIGEAQVRAYLTEPTFKITRDKNDHIESVATIIMNVGQSPAIDVSVVVSVAAFRPKGFHTRIPLEKLREVLSVKSPPDLSGQIAPSGSRKSLNAVSVADAVDYAKNAADIMIFVQAGWQDVFGFRHRMEYCVLLVEDETEREYITHFQIYPPLTNLIISENTASK